MRRSTLTVALTATLIFGLTACGGDDKGSTNPFDGGKTTQPDGGSDATTGGGDVGTIPNNIPGVSEECTQLYNKWITAMGSVAQPGGELDTGALFTELAKVLPDELKDDAKVLADGFSAYSDLLKKYDNDMTKLMADPAAQEALSKLSSEEFSKASDNISAYFDQTCGTS